MDKYDEKTMRRMKALVKVNEETGCHEWQGATGGGRTVNDRYPSMHYRKKTARATRIMYALTYGEIPKGLYVCHSCDNPMCLNPEHLFLGNQKRNVRDAIAKGRFALPPELKGEDHGNAKMKDADVVRWRKEYADGRKRADIAEEAGIGLSTAKRMLSGRTYGHLPVFKRTDPYMNHRKPS